MKILFDENMPRKLGRHFSKPYEIITVQQQGWGGIVNGELLERMKENQLTILISLDKNMSYQQSLEKYDIRLLVLDVGDMRYEALIDYVPKVEKFLAQELAPGLHIIN